MSADGMSADGLLANSNVKVAYFGVLIVLVLLVVFFLSRKSSERMTDAMGTIGGGVTNRVFTSGASMRFGQELSATNQQPYAVPRISDVKAVMSALNEQAGSAKTPEQEMLVNQGGYPDFWTISGELDDYRQQDQADYRAGNQAEHMTSDIFDTRLSGGFYPGASVF